MIVLDLICDHEHRFEGWFASSEAFAEQRQRGLVSCPFCDSGEVSRLPSGPHLIASRRETAAQSVVETPEQVRKQLLEVIKTYVRDSEDVGERFPEEARKIHYNEAPLRKIRGVASLQDTHDLLEEGIVVLPMPVPPDKGTH